MRNTVPRKHWEQQADGAIISGCGWGRTDRNPPGSAAWASCAVAGTATAYADTATAATASATGAGLGSRAASEVPPFTAEALRSFSLFLCEIKQVCWWVLRISALYSYVHFSHTSYRNCFAVVVCRAAASAVERWLPAERLPISW